MLVASFTTGFHAGSASSFRMRARPISSPAYHSLVRRSLYTGQVWKTSRNDVPLWVIAWTMRETRLFTSSAYPRPIHVYPAPSARAMGFTPSWIEASGIDFVFNPFASVGEAWPLVRPYTPLLKTI